MSFFRPKDFITRAQWIVFARAVRPPALVCLGRFVVRVLLREPGRMGLNAPINSKSNGMNRFQEIFFLV